MYVTEDTTRARPETLKALYTLAIECGARRICLADTVGHATPHGVRQLVRFVRDEVVAPTGEDVKLDWHGHRDRGLGLANTLAAIEEGVDRVHGTALGIGERVGNTEMDLLLVNLKLLGMHDATCRSCPSTCEAVSRATGVPIPPSYPCSARTRSARAPACTRPRSSRRSRRATTGWSTACTRACRPPVRPRAAHRDQPCQRHVQRQALARRARLRRERRGALPARVRLAKRTSRVLTD
jgi:hypothetical protein